MNEMLTHALIALHQSGEKHLHLLQTDVAIQEYYEQRQALVKAQAEEIQAQITAIERKYQGLLWQLEQEYAVYVTMITPHKEHA